MVCIIIVSYNTKKILKNCLTSIFKKVKYCSYKVVVVDNASTDGTIEMIKKDFPQVELIASKKNLGFAGGNNLAIKKIKANYYFLLNSDTILLDDAITILVNFLKNNSTVGIVGPKLLNSDKTLQASKRNFANLFSYFLELSGLWNIYKKIPLLKETIYITSSHNKIAYPDWLMGAALMIKKEVFDKVGLFDESYFMYAEELDFCFRASKLGFKIAFLPTAEIIHIGGASTKIINKKMSIFLYKSIYKFLKKHYSKRKIQEFRIITKIVSFFKIIFYYKIKYFLTKNQYYKDKIEIFKTIAKF